MDNQYNNNNNFNNGNNNSYINTNATETNNNYNSNFNNNGFSSNFKATKPPKKKKDKKPNTGPGFGKTIALPFVSGIVGATLVLGICFSVPNIKNNIVGSTNTVRDNNSNINYNNVNLDLVSLSDISDTGVAVAQKVLPSIVGISVEYSVNSLFSRNPSTATAEGSGVIISSDGYILTNNHVIDTSSSTSSSSYYEVNKASKIQVYLYNDDTPYDAKIVGTDEQTDLAVIKIDKTDLTAAELGDSNTVQVGEWCMSVGNPLGMRSTVCQGSISALNRQITDTEGKTYTVMQTDAAINEGNSGGALVNSKGQVIGINTLKASGEGVEGLGFAIPINSTKDIYSDLIQYNKVKRPYIGITGSDITEETVEANPTFDLKVGAYVRSVDDYSPAEKAGIKVGDIITQADGQTVENMDDLNEIKNSHQIGDKMNLTIYRDGSETTVELTLAEQP